MTFRCDLAGFPEGFHPGEGAEGLEGPGGEPGGRGLRVPPAANKAIVEHFEKIK